MNLSDIDLSHDPEEVHLRKALASFSEENDRLRAEKASLHETLLKESTLSAEIADMVVSLKTENARLKAELVEEKNGVKGAENYRMMLQEENSKLRDELDRIKNRRPPPGPHDTVTQLP